jgi:hypothetical protein
VHASRDLACRDHDVVGVVRRDPAEVRGRFQQQRFGFGGVTCLGRGRGVVDGRVPGIGRVRTDRGQEHLVRAEEGLCGGLVIAARAQQSAAEHLDLGQFGAARRQQGRGSSKYCAASS